MQSQLKIRRPDLKGLQSFASGLSRCSGRILKSDDDECIQLSCAVPMLSDVALCCCWLQTPMIPLLVVQLFESHFHALAYQMAGSSNPLPRALAVHALALVVTTLSRTWQLRAYQRWQHCRACVHERVRGAQRGDLVKEHRPESKKCTA